MIILIFIKYLFNVKNGLIKYDDLSEDVKEKFKTLEEIVAYLYNNKFEEELSFSHGDTSLSNIFCKYGKFTTGGLTHYRIQLMC